MAATGELMQTGYGEENLLSMTLESPESVREDLSYSSYQLDDNSNVFISPRLKPIIHQGVDPPLCENCHKLDLSFFDPNCKGCRAILSNHDTTIGEVFAILRQWTPQTQQNLEFLVNEILRRGANINDRDGLTDMTLLHYASKAGASGIGDADMAARVVSSLINKGADSDIRCRWTDMTALHYASYFDVVPVIKVLLKSTKALDIDSTCSEFDHGSALHIAASNLACEAVKVLLQNRANSALRDDMGRMALECVPDASAFEADSEMTKLVLKLRKLLSEAVPITPQQLSNIDSIKCKVTLQALGIRIGDKVVVGGMKTGALRYCGPTEFSAGVWAGIELDEPLGKNDGSVGGISYFRCPSNHGIFAPVSKIAKMGNSPSPRSASSAGLNKRNSYSGGVVDVSHVTAKVDSGLPKSRASSLTDQSDGIESGDRVIVAGQRKGTVRFVGEAKFAPGVWYGIELDRAAGKNDGSVNTTRYFTCKPRHGVFAPISRLQKLGNRHFSSTESLDTISLGAMSERDGRKSAVNGGSSSSMSSRTRHLSVSRARSAPNPSIIRTPGSTDKMRLQDGTTVFCTGYNEMGTVRYVGPTDFADGVWIGVELRSTRGRHDGVVQGKRYFHAKPEHGVLVRPSRVSVRGISGTKLLRETFSPD